MLGASGERLAQFVSVDCEIHIPGMEEILVDVLEVVLCPSLFLESLGVDSLIDATFQT